jgi:hypothetical protein
MAYGKGKMSGSYKSKGSGSGGSKGKTLDSKPLPGASSKGPGRPFPASNQVKTPKGKKKC